MKWLSVLGLTVAAQALPMTSAEAKDYCSMTRNLALFRPLAFDKLNLMAFANAGGLFNQGTCWWHSRLQQSSFYLSLYNPKAPKPNAREAERIISLLMTLRQVVEIPGYNNWYEFSKDWNPLIQRKLNQWQLMEGIFEFAWIRGLSGESKLPTLQLKQKVERLGREIAWDGRIPFAKLQLPGITAHSLLFLEVIPSSTGYDTLVLDSNHPQTVRTISYREGMNQFDGGVPYLERQNDFIKITQSQSKYCSKGRSQDWSLDSLTQDDLDQIIFEDLAAYIEEFRAQRP